MCKNTDQPKGIPVPLPSILPPIEKWYVVARKPSSGTCSIYSSWSDYQAESKIRSPSSSTSAEKEKSINEDIEEKELAAFPIMAQALTYIKAFGRNSESSPPLNSSISSSLLMKNRRQLKPNKHISDPKKRLYKSSLKTIEVIGEGGDCNIDNGDDEKSTSNAKAPPSPVPSGSSLKKRKRETGPYQPGVVNLKKHLSMSKTSETIDIGARTESPTSDTSNLDTLAIAASVSTNKKKVESKQAQPPRVLTINTEDSSVESENAAAVGARLPPSVIFPRGAIHATRPRESFLSSISELPENILGRLPNRLSPSLIADYNNARKSVEQLKLRQDDEKQYELQKQRGMSLLESKTAVPEVPTARPSSLKIPEVPRGFVSEEFRSDRINQILSNRLKSSMDPRASNPSPLMGKAQTYPLLGLPNRMSLESYPLGPLSRQIQGLPQHLQGIPPTSVFRPTQQLLSLQLQSSQNLLNYQSRNSSSAYAQHLRQQQLQALEVASTASGASDGDHSDITLQRHNGRASRDSL